MRYAKNTLEQAWYVLVCGVSGILLTRNHIYPFNHHTVPLWGAIVAWFATFFLGDYLINKHEQYLWKKKVMKLAKQLAEYQGIDPDTLDFKNITAEYDEETGIMEVIIEEKKEGEK